jgi:SAM-dependent methyltransferase
MRVARARQEAAADLTNRVGSLAPSARAGFRAVYQVPYLYDEVLLPHYFDGVEDIDLVGELMARSYGPAPAPPGLAILDLGCGTGRVTACLAPYAKRLRGVDSSRSMVDGFRTRHPQAEAICLDTGLAVAQMLDQGLAGSFDVVGAFWSMSYPLMDFFEELSADGIRDRGDVARGRRAAAAFVRDVVALVAPRGHLFALFFDSETPEQRLVTECWERLAPFPGTGRGYTRQIFLEELLRAEARGQGRLRYSRLGGVAVARDKGAALTWFETVHLKSLAALVDDPEVRLQIERFVHAHATPSGEVLIPTGAYLIDFWAISPKDSRALAPESGTR